MNSATHPIRIQTEIRLDHLVTLYEKGFTRWYLCYNLAKLLTPDLKRFLNETHFVTIEETGSGFEEYCLIDEHFNGDRFQQIVMEQISKWTEKYYGRMVTDHSALTELGYELGFSTSRQFRLQVLKLALKDDPNAVFRIEC